MQTKDQQKDFLDLLRNGYVVSANYLIALFNIRNVDKFVQGIRDRTELDIYEGKTFSFEADADETVYYMTSDIKPECPGLDNMEEAIQYAELLVTPHERIEYQKGYYIMWDCPNRIGDNLCGQFHKVDLANEELHNIQYVRCIKCGKKYLIHPEG